MQSKTSWSFSTQSAKDTLKTTSKRVIQKPAEAIGDLIGNKITNKVTKNMPQNNSNNSLQIEEKTIEIQKERYTYPEERWQIIDELRLI